MRNTTAALAVLFCPAPRSLWSRHDHDASSDGWCKTGRTRHQDFSSRRGCLVTGWPGRGLKTGHDAIRALGIPADHLTTTGYSVYPVYDDTVTPVPLVGRKVRVYRVLNTLLIRIDDVARVGEVIDTAVSSDANQVNSIAFLLSDEKTKALRGEALRQAVNRTRTDAYRSPPPSVAASSPGSTGRSRPTQITRTRPPTVDGVHPRHDRTDPKDGEHQMCRTWPTIPLPY